MKTIITTLPIYDKLSKQCYERARHANSNDIPDSGHGIVPIITPRHRLPSFQWNVQNDNPGEITDIQLMNTDNQSDKNYTISPSNGTYNTYTVTGSSIAVIKTTSNGSLLYGRLAADFLVTVGKLYVAQVTLAYTSGEYPFLTMGYTANPQRGNYYQLKNGVNTVYLIPQDGGPTYSGSFHVYNLNAANFTLTVNSLKESLLPLFSKGLDFTYQYGSFPGFTYDDGDYDVATISANERKLTLQKTTAAGMFGYMFREFNPNPITIGDKIYISTFLTLTSGTAPRMAIFKHAAGQVILSNVVQLVAGQNNIVLIATVSEANTRVVMYNQTGETASFAITFWYMARTSLPSLITLTDSYFQYNGETLSELLPTGNYYLKITTKNGLIYYSEWFLVTCVFGSDTGLPPTTTYSEKYLILNFHNNCDLGDILYHDGFTQTLWFESETMEPAFPTEEEGQKNGEGRFARTFARQTKKYLARTKEMPDFMVDVFNRMKLHDTIQLIDLVGDTHNVYNLEVEHEWLFEDKYYAKIDLTFDYDETVVVSGCCSNIT